MHMWAWKYNVLAIDLIYLLAHFMEDIKTELLKKEWAGRFSIAELGTQ